MQRSIEVAFMLLLALASDAQDKPAFPERPAPEPALSAEQIDEKIADLQRQVEALELKKAEAERLAERQEQLAALHNECKDRIKEVDEQLANMETEEQPTTPAQHACCEGRRAFLGGVKSLSIKILALKEPSALEQARQLRDEIESIEVEWHLVGEPKLDAARMLESLTKDLEQDNNQYRREALEKLRRLADQDAEGRSQELALVNARREREKVRDKLVQAFYRTTGQL